MHRMTNKELKNGMIKVGECRYNSCLILGKQSAPLARRMRVPNMDVDITESLAPTRMEEEISVDVLDSMYGRKIVTTNKKK